jgi:hypothetical protein
MGGIRFLSLESTKTAKVRTDWITDGLKNRILGVGPDLTNNLGPIE